MYNKKLFILITSGLLALSIVIAIIQILGIPLKDVFAAIVMYALLGVLILTHILRFAVVVLGVLAVYRLILERHYKQMAA